MYYLIWTLAIGFIIYLGIQFQQQVVEHSQMTFNPFLFQLYIALFPIVIGLLLRLPQSILERKEQQVKSFDWIKFAAIGIPALIISIMTFLPYSPIGTDWLPTINTILISGTTVPTIAGLIFGYVLLDCFGNKRATTF